MKDYFDEFEKNEKTRVELNKRDAELMKEILLEIGGEYVWGKSKYAPYVVCSYYDEPVTEYVDRVYIDDKGSVRVNLRYGNDEIPITYCEGCIEEIYLHMEFDK